MAIDLLPNEQFIEDDFIDIDINSTALLCYNMPSSPPHPKEFEFQMSVNPTQKEGITSPADELFYKGNLLPLHLPPRMQMVQKLLNHDSSLLNKDFDSFEEYMATNSITQTAASTPFESCNISPTTSCYVSGELNPDDYFYECSSGLEQPNKKKSWATKLKLIRQATIGSKLKASGAYIRSLFSRSKCSEESSCAASESKESSNDFYKAGKRNPFGQIYRERNRDSDINVINGNESKKLTEEDGGPRRSHSLGIMRSSKNKSSSSLTSLSSCSSYSFSFPSVSSDGSSRSHMMRRSSSVHSEFESSIQGAIAYCKMSQKLVSARKSVSDVVFGSLSASRIAAEKPILCRG